MNADQLVLLLIAAAFVPSASAQVSLEVQPFFGYRFGGKFRPGGDAPNLPSLDFRSSRSEGLSTSVAKVEGRLFAGGEFMWNRQPTHALSPSSGTTVPLRMDQYMIHGVIGEAQGEKNRRPLPFGFAGAGVTDIPGFKSRYAYSFGGGVRYFFTRWFGLRLQGRFTPIHLYTRPETYTVIFEPGTSSGTVRNLEACTNQGEFTVGAIFRIELRPRR